MLLKTLFSSKIFGIGILVALLLGIIGYKWYSLESEINTLKTEKAVEEKKVSDRDERINTLNNEITKERVLVSLKDATIESLNKVIDDNNKAIEAIKVETDELNKFIKESSKTSPSKNIIKPNTQGFDKIKGLKYENL